MATLVPRVYNSFRGVDFRGGEINLLRSPDSLNVWKDYKETESIRTRPGLKRIEIPFLYPIYGIFFFKGKMIVHSGKALYELENGGMKQIYGGTGIDYFDLNEAPSSAFIYDDVFYFLDGKHYVQWDGKSGMKEVEGYIPTTTKSRNPMGGGKTYEDVNMMSDYRKNSFISDGVAMEYWLDVTSIDGDYLPLVTVNGVECDYSEYRVDYDKGCIIFLNNPPDKPQTPGQDNVVIQFKKAVVDENGVNKYKDAIKNCTILQEFDNRVFFSGNPEYPNMMWHSSLHNPAYVSDLDYYEKGMDDAAIKGLVAGENALWVFRQPSDANTTIFYHTPSVDDTYGKIYPSSHSSIATGCVGKAVNFNDDIVFFSDRGMEGISGGILTERVCSHRSTVVDRKMCAEPNYKQMVTAEWEGYLFVFIGNKAYLADSRQMYQNENHYEYEWFYWELEHEVICATVKDGVMYLGTKSGIYTLTDTEANIESYWTTPIDKFSTSKGNYANKLKTTNKRGCVVEATGDISVYAKLEDTDFELIGEYNDITDYFVSRIKRKKFKDLQLKFHSNTRFSLEQVTIECFVGGYIKR